MMANKSGDDMEKEEEKERTRARRRRRGGGGGGGGEGGKQNKKMSRCTTIGQDTILYSTIIRWEGRVQRKARGYSCLFREWAIN